METPSSAASGIACGCSPLNGARFRIPAHPRLSQQRVAPWAADRMGIANSGFQVLQSLSPDGGIGLEWRIFQWVLQTVPSTGKPLSSIACRVSSTSIPGEFISSHESCLLA